MANLSNINNKFIVTDGNNGRVLIGATNDIGATLFANHPSTTAPSLTFNAPAGQVFENEDLQFAFGLNNAVPYNGYMQTRFVSAPYYRNFAINPLGGNVGIGTNSPAYKLHVSSTTFIGGTFGDPNTDAAYRLKFYDNGGVHNDPGIGLDGSGGGGEKIWFNAYNGFYWNLGTQGVKMTLSGTGNLGIGTPSPATDLHVNSENAEGSLTISRGGNNMISGQGVGSIVFPADYNGTPTNYGKIVTYANALSALRGSIDLKVKSTSGSLLTGLTVYGTSSGVNVGIGTNSPTSKLQVEGSNTSSIPLLDLRASGTGSFQRGVRLLNSGMNTGDELMYAVGRSDNSRNMGQTYFYYAGDGSTSNRISMGLHSVDDVFNILGTGNVGIGTASPSQKLDIAGNIRIRGANQGILLDTTGADQAARVLVENDYELSVFTNRGAAGFGVFGNSNIRLGFGTAHTSAQTSLFINSSGNVGIGTDLPDAPLEIQNTPAQTSQKMMLHLDANHTGNQGSAYLQISAGSSSGVRTRIEQVTGGGSGFFGTYSDTNIINNSLSSGAFGNINFITGSSTSASSIAMTIGGGSQKGRVGIGVTSNIQGALHVAGRVNTNRIVSSNIILGNIRSNLTTTSYLLLVDLNVTAGFSLAGKLNAASYTTWNVSDIYVRKNYNSATGVASITGISKSGSNLSIVDISHTSGRFIAIKLTGDPEIDVMWTGYRLNNLFGSDGIITTLTSGVTENSVYASY